MPPPIKIQDYLSSLSAQIRWKTARPVVVQEIENHITDQTDAFLAQGLDEAAAVTCALREMGDPVTIGQQLDRVHRPKPDWMVIALTLILVLLGAGVQYLLSLGNPYGSFFFRYLSYAPLGAAAFVVAYFVDYTILCKHAKLVYAALLAVGIVFLFLRPMPYQYMYTLTLLSIPAFAGVIYSERQNGYGGLLVCGVFYLVSVFILTPNYSGYVLFTLTCLILLTISIAKGWFGSVKKPLALSLLYVPCIFRIAYIMASSSVWRRLRVLLHPELDPSGWGYFPTVIRDLLSRSRFWGDAVPAGQFTASPVEAILPAWNTDHILVSLAAKFGYAAAFLLILLMTVLIIRLFGMSLRQKSVLGYMVSLSVTLALALQSFIYLVNNLGFPFFSVTFPLLSFGRGNFVVNMALLGLILSVFRRDSVVRDTHHAPAKVHGGLYRLFHGRVVIDLRPKP